MKNNGKLLLATVNAACLMVHIDEPLVQEKKEIKNFYDKDQKYLGVLYYEVNSAVSVRLYVLCMKLFFSYDMRFSYVRQTVCRFQHKIEILITLSRKYGCYLLVFVLSIFVCFFFVFCLSFCLLSIGVLSINSFFLYEYHK